MKSFIYLIALIFFPGTNLVQAQIQTRDSIYKASDEVFYRFQAQHLEKSSDAGKIWKVLPIQKGKNAGTALPFFIQRNMQWLDKDNGYVFGDDQTYAYSSYILRTFDGGQTWHHFHAENIEGSGFALKKIETIDSAHHVAVLGATTNMLAQKDEVFEGIFLAVSQNGGKKFQLVAVPLKRNQSQWNLEYSFAKDGSGTLQLKDQKWTTDDFGQSWTKMK